MRPPSLYIYSIQKSGARKLQGMSHTYSPVAIMLRPRLWSSVDGECVHRDHSSPLTEPWLWSRRTRGYVFQATTRNDKPTLVSAKYTYTSDIMLIKYTYNTDQTNCANDQVWVPVIWFVVLTDINLLRPSDTIWRHKSGSTLAQVMACCLTAPSHYLNQCWLIISKVQWHSSEHNFTMLTSAISHCS